MWDLQDTRYLRRDGENSMTGALILAGGNPKADNEAVRKAYVDTLTGALPTNAQVAAAIAIVTDPGGTMDLRIAAALLAYLELAGGVMTGPLTLSGAPVNALHAATKAYADLMLPLGGGVMLGALTLSGAPVNALHAATKAYVDSFGLPTYDACVAAAGGDYTSVVAACAAEAVGARIFIKSGTYNETANVVMKDGQMLIGENPDDTIIDFGAANRKITSDFANANVVVRDLTIQGSTADYTVELLGARARVENNRITGTGAAFDGVALTGSQSILARNAINGFSRVGAYAARIGAYCIAHSNDIRLSDGGIWAQGGRGSSVGNYIVGIAATAVRLEGRALLVGNFIDSAADIVVAGSDVLISGNHILGAGGSGIAWAGIHSYVTITGNDFWGSCLSCTFNGSKDCTITGNTFQGGSGVAVDGDEFAISGNTFYGTAFISLGANSERNAVVGNAMAGSTAATKIADLGTANTAKDNVGLASLSEKNFRKMKQTSGGALVAGDVVVLKAVAAGDEVTTTVIQGDDMVFGMVEDANLANDAYGHIQVEGKTVKLKVNGTVAIAIGDLLGTLNAVKIAMKAAAGDMAFAVALEAYAGADSLGRIDALLIKPRKV